MPDEILFNDPAHGWAIATKSGGSFHPPQDVCISRARDGELMGGMLYFDNTGESICVHSAAFMPGWINRDLLWVGFDYPFNQVGVKRIFGRTPADKLDAIRFNLNLGFKEIARINGVYKGGVACVVFQMERDECRHLKIKPRTLYSRKAA